MKEKILTLGDIIYTIPKDYDVIGDATHIEIRKIIKGLLSYVVNLENDMQSVDNTFSIYDIILQYGLYDTVIEFCREDYNRLIKIVDNTFNFDNIYKLITAIQFFDTASYDKWVENMKSLKDTLTPEVLEGIKQLNKMNVTEFTEMVNGMVQEASLQKAQNDLKHAEIIKEKGLAEEEKKEEK